MGDGRQDRADIAKQDDADATRRAFIDAMKEKTAQSPGVAPGFTDQPGAGRDRYYRPPANGVERRPHYGPSGTLYPGAGQDQQQAPPPKNFQEIHADKKVDPNKPWERYDPGIAGTHPNGNKPASRQQFAWNGYDFFDGRVDATINRRSQYTDMFGAYTAAFVAGTVSPLVHSGLTKVADRAVARNPESAVGKYWQEHFDPTKSGAADLSKIGKSNESAYEKFEELKAQLRDASKTGPEADRALAAEKLQFLKDRETGKFSIDHVAQAKVYKAENGAKAFSDAEIAVLEGRAKAGVAAEGALQKATARFAKVQEESPEWVKRGVSGVAGSMFAFGAVGIDRSLTRMEGGPQHGDEFLHKSWNASTFLAPVALAALPGKLPKVGGFVGAIAASQLIDNVTRSILPAPDRWNAATGPIDWVSGASVATGMALAGYAKNPWAKAAIAAVSTTVPVLVHAYDDNIGGNIKGRTDAVRDSLSNDHQDRSLHSLERVNSKMSDLMGHQDIVTRSIGGLFGISKEASTRGKSDWIVANADASYAGLNTYWNKMNYEQRLLSLRDDAGAAGAIGETTLANGTRVSDKTTTERYVVGGYDIDLGGRALHYLIRSRNSADKAAQLTEGIIENNNDSTKPTIKVQGDVPKPQEVKDLQTYSDNINQKVDALLNGKHDIRGAYDALTDQSKVLDKEYIKTFIRQTSAVIGEYDKRRDKAQREADSATDDDARKAAMQRVEENNKVMAKVYRDQAMVYMAIARATTKDGGGAYDLLIDDGRNHDPGKDYNGAQGALRKAEALSPNNPDMEELGKIFTEQVSDMVKKKQAQIDNPSTNVLGYHDGYTRAH